MGVRTPAKFILKFTHGRAIAFDSVRKNYLKDRHSIQFFTSIFKEKLDEKTKSKLFEEFKFDQSKHESAV